MIEHVQTKREIESLLEQAGLRPRKRFGQHFLIDGNLMRLLVESAEMQPVDTVIEVGPGTGGLTDLLVAHAGRVICVEIDRDLFAFLTHRFSNQPNIELICADALDGKHKLNPVLVESLRNSAGPVKLVANLPYDAATPLLMNLVLGFPVVSRFCFTVQSEVGDRIMAKPGTKVYGPLSVILQTFCAVEQVARLGPQSFWPRPQVDSVMLRMDRVLSPAVSPAASEAFASFVHRIFEYRRKQLGAALAYVVDAKCRARLVNIIDARLRAEQLDPPTWVRLFQAAS